MRRRLPPTRTPRSATELVLAALLVKEKEKKNQHKTKQNKNETTAKLFPLKERVGRICSAYLSRPRGPGGVQERAFCGEPLAVTVDVRGFK